MSAARKSCRLLGYINKHYGRTASKNIVNLSCFQTRSIYTTSLLNEKIQFNLSDIGEGIREVAVKEWFVKVGDKVAQFDNICEVQSDKASVTITSRYDGVITKLHYKIDDTALVGKPLVDIETEGEAGSSSSSSSSEDDAPAPKAVVPETSAQTCPFDSYPRELCIPSVRRLAKEHNIRLAEIKGTGKGGRILKEDVLKYLDGGRVPTAVTSSALPTAQSRAVGDRVEPIKGFKKAMVKTMTDALSIPHFTYSDEIAVTKIGKVREAIKEETKKLGIKMSFMPFFIKAASNGLLEYPILNATVDKNCDNITYKGAHNIGIAMDTKMGLAVPVIKNVQDLTIIEIARELNRLMTSGKEGNFAPNDLQGGTFAISNIGVIGGTYTKPVILPPQVAIIALGAAKVLPRFDSNMNVVAEEIISISGSADHRVVDGASMAKFITLFKKQIENPYLLFLNL